MEKRVVLGIVMANYPPASAGHQFSVLHWLTGFRELGWDVWITESIKSSDCVNCSGDPCSPEESRNVAGWRQFVADFGFSGRESLYIDGCSGESEALRRFCDGAELFLNYAGQFELWTEIAGARTKVYLDVDPGYTQVWASEYNCEMNLEFHDRHVSVGLAIDRPWCRIPKTNHAWIPTVPPVSRSLYGGGDGDNLGRPGGPWTTVTHWYGVGEVHSGGLKLRGKRESFLPLVTLPRDTSRQFLVATDLRPEWEDYSVFGQAGWTFCGTDGVCRSRESYLGFLRASTGELGVAKEGYVTAQTGWLSDRTMSYLACGRPVVALDTGWSRIIGEFPGLRAFSTASEAAAAIKDVEKNYHEACRSALELADGIFAATNVLPQLLREVCQESNLGMSSPLEK